jgi:hypothetical protein
MIDTAVFALMRYILAPSPRAMRGLGVGFLYLITQRKCCNGVRLGWLINPQNQKVEIVQLPILLSGEEVLPGFELQF